MSSYQGGWNQTSIKWKMKHGYRNDSWRNQNRSKPNYRKIISTTWTCPPPINKHHPKSTETEQKSIPVEANRETTMKVPENASLQQQISRISVKTMLSRSSPETSSVSFAPSLSSSLLQLAPQECLPKLSKTFFSAPLSVHIMNKIQE